MDSAIVGAIVGPVVTGLMAALGVWLRGRLQRRNRQHAYREAVRHAAEQLAFIEGWLRTHQQLASPEEHEQARQRALSDLQRTYAQVDTALTAVRTREPFSARRALGRLLIRDLPLTTGGRVVGALYYLSLAWLVVWASFGVAIGAVAVGTGGQGSFLGGAVIGLGTFLLSLSIGAAPVLPLYFAATSAKRPRSGAAARGTA